MKNHLIVQKFGIGDAIFSMSAIRSLRGHILWPVLPEYVEGLSRAYPEVFFFDFNLIKIDWNRKDRYELNGIDVIPLAHQDAPLKDCMKNKYLYFSADWTQWKRNAAYNRDFSKEYQLFKHLGLSDGEKFNLVNVNWGCWSPTVLKPGTNQANLQGVIGNEYKIIPMDIIPGYSLFDWSTVIERATEIHTVSTSILFLLELLNLSAKEIHLYCRKPNEKDFRNVDYIFTKNYQLHY